MFHIHYPQSKGVDVALQSSSTHHFLKQPLTCITSFLHAEPVVYQVSYGRPIFQTRIVLNTLALSVGIGVIGSAQMVIATHYHPTYWKKSRELEPEYFPYTGDSYDTLQHYFDWRQTVNTAEYPMLRNREVVENLRLECLFTLNKPPSILPNDYSRCTWTDPTPDALARLLVAPLRKKDSATFGKELRSALGLKSAKSFLASCPDSSLLLIRFLLLNAARNHAAYWSAPAIDDFLLPESPTGHYRYDGPSGRHKRYRETENIYAQRPSVGRPLFQPARISFGDNGEHLLFLAPHYCRVRLSLSHGQHRYKGFVGRYALEAMLEYLHGIAGTDVFKPDIATMAEQALEKEGIQIAGASVLLPKVVV